MERPRAGRTYSCPCSSLLLATNVQHGWAGWATELLLVGHILFY